MAAGGHGGPVGADWGAGMSSSSPLVPVTANAPAAAGGSGQEEGAEGSGLRDIGVETAATSSLALGVGGSSSSPRRPALAHASAALGWNGRGGAGRGGLHDMYGVGEVVDHAVADDRVEETAATSGLALGVGGSSSSPRGTALTHASADSGWNGRAGAGRGGLLDIHVGDMIHHVVPSLCAHREALVGQTPIRNIVNNRESIFGKIKFPRVPKKPPINSPKLPRTSIQPPSPRSFTLFSIGAISSILYQMGADLFKFIRKIADTFFSYKSAIVILLLWTFVYRLYIFWNHRHGGNGFQNVIGRKIVLFADDNFGYPKARRMLKTVSQMNQFEVVIPLCVTEWLENKMHEGGSLSHMARASLLMIKDLKRLGQISVQTAEEESGPRGTETELRSYEDRIINCASVLRSSNPDTIVVVVSNSKCLQNRARSLNLSSCGAQDLLD